MSIADETPVVSRDDENHRYEIRLGDVLAGFVEFDERRPGRLVFRHTEIDPAFSGRSLASALVSAALRDVAARAETLVPVCPFVLRYLEGADVPGLTVDARGANA